MQVFSRVKYIQFWRQNWNGHLKNNFWKIGNKQVYVLTNNWILLEFFSFQIVMDVSMKLKASEPLALVFYLKVKGDHYHRLVNISVGDERKGAFCHYGIRRWPHNVWGSDIYRTLLLKCFSFFSHPIHIIANSSLLRKIASIHFDKQGFSELFTLSFYPDTG